MYVRDARNRDEAWLIDQLEELGLDESAFRSRDFVIAVEEDSGEKAGFGRLRIHTGDDEEVTELTSLGVLEAWRGQGVGAHVIERLVEQASDQDFDVVYAFVENPEYLQQFGFEPAEDESLPAVLSTRLENKRADVTPDAIPMILAVEDFEMPADLREAFKAATSDEGGEEGEPEETAEDFGIDPEEATYKYDVG
jgi:N-acetylglutamate synthase-like GNAT family acetyltransferase